MSRRDLHPGRRPSQVPRSLLRHLPSVPRENHGSKTVGEAVFVQITSLSRGCHLHFLRTLPNFFRLEMKKQRKQQYLSTWV